MYFYICHHHNIQQARNTLCRGPGAYSVNIWGQRPKLWITNRANNEKKVYLHTRISTHTILTTSNRLETHPAEARTLTMSMCGGQRPKLQITNRANNEKKVYIQAKHSYIHIHLHMPSSQHPTGSKHTLQRPRHLQRQCVGAAAISTAQQPANNEKKSYLQAKNLQKHLKKSRWWVLHWCALFAIFKLVLHYLSLLRLYFACNHTVTLHIQKVHPPSI